MRVAELRYLCVSACVLACILPKRATGDREPLVGQSQSVSPREHGDGRRLASTRASEGAPECTGK